MVQMTGNYVKKMYSRFVKDDHLRKCRLLFNHLTPQELNMNKSMYLEDICQVRFIFRFIFAWKAESIIALIQYYTTS